MASKFKSYPILLGCFVTSLLAQGTIVPFAYHANTTIVTATHSATPTVGAAGTTFTECDIVAACITVTRVTDGNTGTGSDTAWQNFDHPSTASSDDKNFSAYATPAGIMRFLVANKGGSCLIFRLNVSTSAISNETPLNSTDISKGILQFNGNASGHSMGCSPGSPQFSSVNPNLLFAINPTTHSVVQWDFSVANGTGQPTTVVATTSLCNSTAHYQEFSTSSTDMQVATVCGGTAQGNDMYVWWYDRNTTTTHVLKTDTNTIDGSAFAAGSNNISDTIHNARVDGSGRYVFVATLTGLRFAWDTQTGLVTQITEPQAQGHFIYNYQNIWLNDYQATYPQFAVRVAPNWNSSYLQPIIPGWTFGFNASGSHPNTTSSPDVPFGHSIGAYYLACGNTACAAGSQKYTPFLNEIAGLSIDGTNRYWRFLWTRANEPLNNFSYIPILHCDQSGVWCGWNSDMEETLGNNSDGNPLVSWFLVKLPRYGTSTTMVTGRTQVIGKRQ